MLPPPTVYYGAVINPLTLTSFRALPDCLIAVSPSGHIDWILEDVHSSALQETLYYKGYLDAHLVVLDHGEFIIPGFIDTHTHPCQLPNMGCGQQYQLLDWLEKVTFPMESKFADVKFARRTYNSVVRRIIDSGTTTCCYFPSLHLEAAKVLTDVVHALGQRAFIGKCNMDRNSPETYRDPSPQSSIAATNELLSYISSLPSSTLVNPILTPRFAISCTLPLLASLGALAASDPTLRIQTHVSELPSEIAFTKALFPQYATYTGVYDACGLLRSNTVLAHGVHLEDEELGLIANRGAGLSHCPTSNLNLGSGVARVGEWLDRGIKVGLGTDASGGYSPSILTAIRHASIASKIVASQTQPSLASTTITADKPFTNRPLSIATLLYLATLGGAHVCDLRARVGSFAPGKSFDALLITVREEVDNPNIWGVGDEAPGPEALEAMLEKFLFCGDDRNIIKVFVQGRLVGGKAYNR